MKRGLVLSVFLVLILVVSISFVSAQIYSGFSKFTDNIKLFFSSGDGKVKLALEIREKEINSAIDNAKAGNNEDAIKNLEAAKDKLKLVRERISLNTAEEVKSSVGEVQNKIEENKDVNSETSKYFEEYLTEEEKTKLSVDLSEKVFDYCKELASQDYNLMMNDEKCKSYSWMEGIVKEGVEKERLGDIEKIKKEMSTCMNNPKDCNCDEISLASEKANCEKYKASSIRCEFQNDDAACKKIENIKIEGVKDANEQTREELEKEILEKYLPAECSEAGVKDGEECKKLILTLNQPKSECMQNGEYIGDENCKEKLVNQGNVVKECVVDGKLVDPEQCRNIVKEGNKPTGKEWELMSGECKEQGVYDPVACDEIVNLPRPCKDAGYYTKKECEAMTLNQNLPKECVDAGALTPEACEKLKLPSDCQGAYSREECEKIKIEQKFPEECKSAGELDPAKCAVIMVGEESLVVTVGAEMEYLVRQGLTFEEIPGVCMNGKNFIRSMDCDAELAKLGITLPPPSDTSNIPKECMVDGAPVSPQECQGKLEKKIIIDTIPKECVDAEITNPEECGNLIEEKRIEEGIGINMPSECVGISIEDCKKIMEEKGIKVEKIENEGMTLPEECIKMGVSDVKDCNMIAGRVNEERIKNGEKIIVDGNGKVDYINPEQIEKIADDSEKASKEVKPDFEKAEEIKQEINTIDKAINTIDKAINTIDKPSNEVNGDNSNTVDKPSMDKENEDVTPAPNTVDDGVNPGPQGIVGASNGESGGGNSGGGDSNGGNNVVIENSGGDSGMTGAVIGSGDKKSFLGKLLKGIFGI